MEEWPVLSKQRDSGPKAIMDFFLKKGVCGERRLCVLLARIRRRDSIFHARQCFTPAKKVCYTRTQQVTTLLQDSDELWGDVRLQSFYDCCAGG